ncbi:MAG: penicillin-binding transpeptidase domain-containing protein [Wenzhouxiangellaceae bacterium]|nr:penicillin-binding transpeptidase domain-containing protein [Wenzhouxiangellaceae bacterium]
MGKPKTSARNAAGSYLGFRGGVLAVLAWLAATESPATVCEAPEPIPAAVLERGPALQAVAFAAVDLRTGRCAATAGEGIEARRAPWSTFKIPHFLIALEAGAASPGTVFEPDPARFPPERWWSRGWREAQDLDTAFGRSTVWVFRMLTDRIEEAIYDRWLQRFDYGNREIGIDRDDFWLGGPLAISVVEHVDFLHCLLSNGCGVSAEARRGLDAAAALGSWQGYRLHGKTGSGPRTGDVDGPFEGWFAGWLRAADGRAVAVFALHAQADSFAELRTARREKALALLAALDLHSQESAESESR